MSWIIFQVLCRFWINLCIFLFLPPNFNPSYSFTSVWLLTRTYTFVNHIRRMRVSTFQFKQLFNFRSDPLNTNIVFFISENIKLFHKTFREFFILWTVWYIHYYNLLRNIRETRGNNVVVSFLLFFLWIASMKKILFNFWYLICWKAGYVRCSVQITNDSIPFLLFRNLW